MSRNLEVVALAAVLGLCLTLPLSLAGRASPAASPSHGPAPERRWLQTTEVADWTRLDDELPLLERAEPAEVGILGYQVTIAAAGANCRGETKPPPDAQREADRLAGRVYSDLSCSPVTLLPTRRSWFDFNRRQPVKKSARLLQPLPEIESAIERGAEVTGVSPIYLRRTAVAESGLRPSASAEASSARGLFQFLEGTWLVMVHRYGTELGLSRAASEIEIDGSGHARVKDPAARAAILALRADPLVSTAVAGMLTRENADRLSASGLSADDARTLYAAHVLGAHGAVVLYNRLLHRPQDPGVRTFRTAARSNPALFQAGGHPLSVEGLVQVLQRKVGD